MKEISKTYNPQETEEKIYKLWEESGFFNPDNLPERNQKGEPYSIVLPPPNVTGTLHLGHALMLIIQDILIRFERMRGRKTLWVPGTDHAAIATQAKVEAIIYKEEEKTRHDLGREEFLKRVEDFAQKSHDTIVGQIKRMGASVDWSREAYTLDDTREVAVRTAFKRMYNGGVIYQGHRIVNWDPKLQTTVSDDEIEWKEEKSPLYYLQYGPFVIATARPETKFGDKYVVMHPEDRRYKEYKNGQKIEVEWINGKVSATVVKDQAIDPEFGTGVMTITPWHDTTDFEIAERHNLDKEQIINERGLLLPIAGEFAGEHIKKARPKIVEKLKEKGLLVKVDENYSHRVATNSRGGGLIEPQIKKQWFIDVNKKFQMPQSGLRGIKTGDEVSLKQIMKHVVEAGLIEIIPDYHKKIYFHWIDNLRDWCISRQIWYGHRIPVWYCARPGIKCAGFFVAVEPPQTCPGCGGPVEQDPDTLDTWFSSGLWTFSTLGWPKNTEDLKTYHPTTVMETGYDILFFWVARMILMTTYLLGEIPFKTVYLHGLVRDPENKKMSKSAGNIVDPLDIANKYGTDALRFALIFNTAAGTDQPLAEDKIKGMKHFANKLWNIARFVLTNLEAPNSKLQTPKAITNADKIILEKLEITVKEVTENLENFKFHEAAQTIYQFTWREFADVYIEASKQQLQNEKQKNNTQNILLYTLDSVLKLLHPFMPFVTEEIWSRLTESQPRIRGPQNGPGQTKDLLMVEKWPN